MVVADMVRITLATEHIAVRKSRDVKRCGESSDKKTGAEPILHAAFCKEVPLCWFMEIDPSLADY